MIQRPTPPSSSTTTTRMRPSAPRSNNNNKNMNNNNNKKRRFKLPLRWFLCGILVLVTCLVLTGLNILMASHATHKLDSFQHPTSSGKKSIRMGVLGKSSKPPLVLLSRYGDDDGVAASAKFAKARRWKSQQIKKALLEISAEKRIQATACQTWKKDGNTIGGHDIQDTCKDVDTLYVRNPISHSRWFCGKEIPPQSIVKVTNCHSPSYLFEKEPTVSGAGMPPEVVSASDGSFEAYGAPFVHCPTSPCQMAIEGGILSNYFLKDAPWSFTYSMEGSGYYPTLEINPNAYRKNEFYATTSFRSEIPLPYFSWAEYDIHRPMLDYDKAIKGASFLARNCGSNNDRESLVENLTQLMRVDALSTCLHNQEFQAVGLHPNDDKETVQRKYLFHLAFENTCEDDYITEKLWGTLSSGTLPVYFGAPNVKEHAPPNSIISVHDFDSDLEKLAAYLIKVANNRTLYESYHAWRKEPQLPLVFRKKYNFTHQHSICRICMWSYAKRYGFGWDHESQTVRDTLLSREVCLDEEDNGHGFLLRPVEESFYSATSLMELNVKHKKEKNKEEEQDTTMCTLLEKPKAISFNGWKRTIYSTDGVLDIVLQRTDKAKDVIYALTMPFSIPTTNTTVVNNNPRTLTEHIHYVFQNDVSRVTILLDPPSQLMYSNNNKGSVVGATEQQQQHRPILGIRLLHSKTRIRVLVADVDTFHKDARERISYFEEFAAHDFLEPLQRFSSTTDG